MSIKYCSSCAQPVEYDIIPAKFCPNCGKPLDSAFKVDTQEKKNKININSSINNSSFIETVDNVDLEDGIYDAIQYGYTLEIDGQEFSTKDGIRCSRQNAIKMKVLIKNGKINVVKDKTKNKSMSREEYNDDDNENISIPKINRINVVVNMPKRETLGSFIKNPDSSYIGKRVAEQPPQIPDN